MNEFIENINTISNNTPSSSVTRLYTGYVICSWNSSQHATGLHFTDKGSLLVVEIMGSMCIFNIYGPAKYIVYNF